MSKELAKEMAKPKLGDLLDRYVILVLKVWEQESSDGLGAELAGLDGELAGELDHLTKELRDSPAYSPADLVQAIRLGAVNGCIWTINDWSRKHPDDWKYRPVQRLNDQRRFEVKGLNEGAE